MCKHHCQAQIPLARVIKKKTWKSAFRDPFFVVFKSMPSGLKRR